MARAGSNSCYLGVSLCIAASIPSPCGQGALIGGGGGIDRYCIVTVVYCMLLWIFVSKYDSYSCVRVCGKGGEGDVRVCVQGGACVLARVCVCVGVCSD